MHPPPGWEGADLSRAEPRRRFSRRGTRSGAVNVLAAGSRWRPGSTPVLDIVIVHRAAPRNGVHWFRWSLVSDLTERAATKFGRRGIRARRAAIDTAYGFDGANGVGISAQKRMPDRPACTTIVARRGEPSDAVKRRMTPSGYWTGRAASRRRGRLTAAPGSAEVGRSSTRRSRHS